MKIYVFWVALFHDADNVNPDLFIKTDKILMQNCVVGCTMAFNRAARDLSVMDLDSFITVFPCTTGGYLYMVSTLVFYILITFQLYITGNTGKMFQVLQ